MMKINDSQRLSSLQAYRTESQTKPAKAAGSGKAGARHDQVRISPEAKELLEAQRMNDASRSERIEELKRAVQTGTYHVSADKIAEKLMPYLK